MQKFPIFDIFGKFFFSFFFSGLELAPKKTPDFALFGKFVHFRRARNFRGPKIVKKSMFFTFLRKFSRLMARPPPFFDVFWWSLFSWNKKIFENSFIEPIFGVKKKSAGAKNRHFFTFFRKKSIFIDFFCHFLSIFDLLKNRNGTYFRPYPKNRKKYFFFKKKNEKKFTGCWDDACCYKIMKNTANFDTFSWFFGFFWKFFENVVKNKIGILRDTPFHFFFGIFAFFCVFWRFLCFTALFFAKINDFYKFESQKIVKNFIDEW